MTQEIDGRRRYEVWRTGTTRATHRYVGVALEDGRIVACTAFTRTRAGAISRPLHPENAEALERARDQYEVIP